MNNKNLLWIYIVLTYAIFFFHFTYMKFTQHPADRMCVFMRKKEDIHIVYRRKKWGWNCESQMRREIEKNCQFFCGFLLKFLSIFLHRWTLCVYPLVLQWLDKLLCLRFRIGNMKDVAHIDRKINDKRDWKGINSHLIKRASKKKWWEWDEDNDKYLEKRIKMMAFLKDCELDWVIIDDFMGSKWRSCLHVLSAIFMSLFWCKIYLF